MILKRKFPVLLLLLLILSLLPLQAAFANPANKNINILPTVYADAYVEKTTFPDMDKHWAKDNVERLAALKIVQGYPDGNFYPDKAVTRAEFAAMLVRVFEFAKVELVQTTNGTFTDISESDWYYDVVSRLAPEGIILGYPDGTFGPNKLITREEASAILARALTKFNIDPAEMELTFTDKDAISPWARPSVSKVTSENIVQGMPDGSFLPKDNSTRAEAAVMLYRLLDKLDLL